MINSAKPDLFEQCWFMLTRFARLLVIITRGAYDLKVVVHLEEEGDRSLQFDNKSIAESAGMFDDHFLEFSNIVIATVSYQDLALSPA
jgi:hypothetical protein